MTDFFKILGVARRLVIADDELRVAYDARCREDHPDAGGEADAFREVQKAYAVLQSPGRRLRHWLELEAGGFESRGEAPDEVLDVFGEVGGVLERLRELGQRKAAAKSALAKSMAEREGVLALAEIEALQGRVGGVREKFTARFAEFEAAGAEACRDEAGSIARGLAFLEKWEGELREAAFGLV